MELKYCFLVTEPYKKWKKRQFYNLSNTYLFILYYIYDFFSCIWGDIGSLWFYMLVNMTENLRKNWKSEIMGIRCEEGIQGHGGG